MRRTGKLVDLHKKVKARRRRVRGRLAVCEGIGKLISKLNARRLSLGWVEELQRCWINRLNG